MLALHCGHRSMLTNGLCTVLLTFGEARTRYETTGFCHTSSQPLSGFHPGKAEDEIALSQQRFLECRKKLGLTSVFLHTPPFIIIRGILADFFEENLHLARCYPKAWQCQNSQSLLFPIVWRKKNFQQVERSDSTTHSCVNGHSASFMLRIRKKLAPRSPFWLLSSTAHARTFVPIAIAIDNGSV